MLVSLSPDGYTLLFLKQNAGYIAVLFKFHDELYYITPFANLYQNAKFLNIRSI